MKNILPVRPKLLLPVVALVLAMLPLQAARAQEKHTVKIVDGTVTVDGMRIPPEALPPSLETEVLNATLNFVGEAFFDLNGIVYRIQDGKLVEADEFDADDSTIKLFFSNPMQDSSFVRFFHQPRPSFNLRYDGSGEHPDAMRNYYRQLSDKAREFRNLSVRIDGENLKNTAELARELKIKAENTARIAGAFPRIEFESYLQDLHSNDNDLYNQLIREQDMERETRQLARQARGARSELERRKFADALESRLGEIFELKQQNREREIKELSRRLDELRDRLSERSKLRKKIIASRMNELLGTSDW